MKRLAVACFWLHVVALALGVFGIVFAIPRAETWTNPSDIAFFAWALPRAGSLGMVTGALAMLVWGASALGWRRTLIFAAISCAVSAAAELTGTKTGWPFGGYEYLTLLGWKIAGRVPYGVPLSWFYMGFAAYVLALGIVPAGRPGRGAICVFLGAWLLMAWDLVLDPAMAALPQIKFWEWHEHGAYFGMPLRNLVGWYATGVAFIGLSRLAWREDLEPHELDLTFPFAVYAVNIVWSMILAISAGLWTPAIAAIFLSLAPAALALRPQQRAAADAA